MRKALLAFVVVLSTLICMGILTMADQNDFLFVGGVEYYKEISDGNFNMIYNLEPGKIKVHTDFRNPTGQAGTAVLIANVIKDGDIVQTVVSESKNFSDESSEVNYLAIDVDVEDDGCQIESFIAGNASGIPQLTEKSIFVKKEVVVVPDPGNSLSPLSDKVSLMVNGQNVPVRRELLKGLQEGSPMRVTPDKYFLTAKFSMQEGQPVTLELKGMGGITTGSKAIRDPLQVSPRALDIPRYTSKGVGYIILDKPQTIVIRNWSYGIGEGYEDLIILVTSLETDVPYKYAQDVTYYADGVQSCQKNPEFSDNQIVYFEKGYHADIGRLSLKPGMKLYLAPGATLDACINTVGVSGGLEGIKVYGRGILETRKASKEPGNISKGIYFEKCDNVRIEGIGVRNPEEWQTLYVDCSNFEIDIMNIMGIVLNNDGIDIDGVNDFKITNNFIMAGDDCFGWHGVNYNTIKSEEHPFGKPTKNVVADNNIMYGPTGGNGIRIGSSMEQESFTNVRVTNTYAVVLSGYGISVDNVDWAEVSDIIFENFFVEEFMNPNLGTIKLEVLKNFDSRASDFPPSLPSQRGSVSDITFKNFYGAWKGNPKPVQIGGWDAEHTIKNITFENVQIQKGSLVFTGGAGTSSLSMEQIGFIPSVSGDGNTYVSQEDVTIK